MAGALDTMPQTTGSSLDVLRAWRLERSKEVREPQTGSYESRESLASEAAQRHFHCAALV